MSRLIATFIRVNIFSSLSFLCQSARTEFQWRGRKGGFRTDEMEGMGSLNGTHTDKQKCLLYQMCINLGQELQLHIEKFRIFLFLFLSLEEFMFLCSSSSSYSSRDLNGSDVFFREEIIIGGPRCCVCVSYAQEEARLSSSETSDVNSPVDDILFWWLQSIRCCCCSRCRCFCNIQRDLWVTRFAAERDSDHQRRQAVYVVSPIPTHTK